MDALRESTKEVKRRSNYAVEQVMKMQKRKTKEERGERMSDNLRI